MSERAADLASADKRNLGSSHGLVSDQVKFACLPSAMAQSVQERYAVEELMRDSMQRQMISLKLLKRWGMGQERARGT
ncbi:MAG: hypothetical protein P8X77_05705 [Maritimibacter sp.]